MPRLTPEQVDEVVKTIRRPLDIQEEILDELKKINKTLDRWG